MNTIFDEVSLKYWKENRATTPAVQSWCQQVKHTVMSTQKLQTNTMNVSSVIRRHVPDMVSSGEESVTNMFRSIHFVKNA